MAVHNGEDLIRRKLDSLLALDYPRELLNIIVISDGSTDGTEAIVREFEHRGVTLLAAPRGGKAAALNRGLAAAEGEILFFTDVRQPLEPQCVRHLVSNFADASVGRRDGRTPAGARRHRGTGGYGLVLALRGLGAATALRDRFAIHRNRMHLCDAQNAGCAAA